MFERIKNQSINHTQQLDLRSHRCWRQVHRFLLKFLYYRA